MIYQLKVTLAYSKPPIWRRLEVEGTLSLAQLHWVIQLSMGWTNSHLHHFVMEKGFIEREAGQAVTLFLPRESLPELE